MNRNLWLVLGTAVFFGLATGIYEYIFPLFLQARNVSFEQMGIIFAISGVAMVLVRIYMGGLSDQLGRKPLFASALAVCGLAIAAPPLLPGLLLQLLAKMFREIAALTRETIFPIVLYEEQRGAFLNFIGKFRGVEFMVQAGGTLLAGLIIAKLGADAGYPISLYLAGGALVLVACWFFMLFREHRSAPKQQTVSLRDLFNLDLHSNLRVILVAGIIFTFGVMLSHSFFLPLFFIKRFPGEVAEHWNPILMSLHRVTIALPMLLVGNLRLKNLRAWYIWGFIIEGVTMAACAVIPNYWASAGVFLLHDLIGAGIWSPIQATIIQRFSRDATRGIEVGKVLAWTSLGGVAGPLAAGFLAGISPVYPFLLSGLIMIAAAIPLFWLKLEQPAAVAVKAEA
ncbi:MAG: MFS transporter [Armatimonadota bacterium]